MHVPFQGQPHPPSPFLPQRKIRGPYLHLTFLAWIFPIYDAEHKLPSWASHLGIRQPPFFLVLWSLPLIILFWDNLKPYLSFKDSYDRVWPQPWPKLWTFSIPQDWKPTTFRLLDLPPSSYVTGKEKNIHNCGRLNELGSLYVYSTSICSTCRMKHILATKPFGFLIWDEGRCPNFHSWHGQWVLFTVTWLLKWVTYACK